jgi:hypothetical protein
MVGVSRRFLLVEILAFVPLLVVTNGGATGPGGNGRIAFGTYLDPQQTWRADFTVDPDGSAARR